MKICIVGAFGFDMIEKTTGGQPVKTRQLYYTLSEHYGSENVSYIETYGWKSHPFQMLSSVFHQAKKSDAIIMLPAHNGVQIFGRLLAFCKKKYGVKIFYDVIGGWLPEKTKDDVRLSKQLKQFDGIWVETNMMKTGLESQGFHNIAVVPNFRKMKILSSSEMIFPQGYPLRMCTFSRVMKEKGIETAIKVIGKLNKHLGYHAISLDIYGPVDEVDKEWFESIKTKFTDGIAYKGCVNPGDSLEVLSQYFCLLFPTHFYTEGVPGTIIDAYAAGLPVISAKWSNFDDVVEDGKTGFGYFFDDVDDFYRVLDLVAQNPNKIIEMKENCVIKARSFHSDYVVETIASDLRGGGV